MSGINKVILVGHLGKEPELRYLADGVPVASFPIVTSEMGRKENTKVEQTEWHNIVMWRSLAESAARMLKKGSLIYIDGKVRTRSFIHNEGNKKYVTEIVAGYFTLLGRKSDFGDDKADENY